MESVRLTTRIKEAPATPGVYIWRGKAGRVLYVGKAVNLRSRLLSYAKTKDPRITAMVAEARTVDWETTPTDIEALILESRLIKLRKPKFNIVMRDDKQYFFVVITKEEFPHIFLTHQPVAFECDIIGPFTDGVPLKATLRILRTLFPYCTCPASRDPAKRDKQKHRVKCLNAHIGKCLGFCCLKVKSSKLKAKSYRRNIHAITDILTGKRDTLIRRLETQMKALGKTHRLDEALELQRRIERIRRVFENARIIRYSSPARKAQWATGLYWAAHHTGALQQLVSELGLADKPKRIEGYDVAHIQGSHVSGAMVVFTDGRPDKAQYRLFNLRTDAAGDTAQLREMLTRRLKHNDPDAKVGARWPLPDLIVVDGGRAQLNTVQLQIENYPAGRDPARRDKLKIPVIALTKNDKHQADHLFSSLDSNIRMLTDLPRAMRDLLVHIDTEAHRFAIQHYRKRHRKRSVQ